MTISFLSEASSPVKEPDVDSHGQRWEMPSFSCSCRGSPRHWELRKAACSSPVLGADERWPDAALSLPLLTAPLTQAEEKNSLPAAMRCSQSEGAHRCLSSQIDDRFEKPIRPKPACFPPPLEAPVHLLYEGRFHCLQTVEKVRFSTVRNNGGLLVIKMPMAAEPKRSLRVQRHDGRLLIQLHGESNPAEEHPASATGREEKELPPAMGAVSTAVTANPLVEEVKETAEDEDLTPMEAGSLSTIENPVSQEAANTMEAANHTLCWEEEEEGDGDGGGGDIANGSKTSLHTKVFQAVECEAFSGTIESCSCPMQLRRRGRSSGVASFLDNSLTRVRPLHMLSI